MNKIALFIVSMVLIAVIAIVMLYMQHRPKQPTQLTGPIAVVTEGIYPPFSMYDENGELTGFDVDIAKALCERLRVDCKIVADRWENIPPGLNSGKYDAIINSMSITEQREEIYDFSNPYYSNYLAFVAQQGENKTYQSPSDLKGEVIGVQRSTVSSGYLEGITGLVQVSLYDKQDQAWQALEEGKVDAVMTDKLLAYEWLRQNEDKNFEFVGEPIDINDKIGIAFREKDTDMVVAFNQALAEILKDGTYDRINQKYFPFSIY